MKAKGDLISLFAFLVWWLSDRFSALFYENKEMVAYRIVNAGKKFPPVE